MPMDEITLKIGGLLEVAEAQQQAVAMQLEQLQQQTAILAQAAAMVNRAAQQAVLALQEAAEAAMSEAVRETLHQAADTALAALEGVSEPVMAQWSAMTQEARAADTRLRRAVAWFSWRWAALLGFLGAGVVLAVVLVTNTLVGWERFQVDSLSEQRAALTDEVHRLEATAKTWHQKAGRANLTTCGGRLCVEIDEAAGRWTFNNDPLRPMAIIKGY